MNDEPSWREVARHAIARHYDELDVFYREVWGEHLHHGLWIDGDETPERAARQLSERVIQEARIRPGDAVCDVGCGYGATARLLAGEFSARVTALTLSEAQLRYAEAQSAGRRNPAYRLQDWLDNDLSANSFDAAIAIESLGHMTDRRRALAEMRRVLKPGGRVIFCAWLASESARLWERQFLLDPIAQEGRLPDLPTAASYRRDLSEVGLVLHTEENLSRRVRRTWTICCSRAVRKLLTDARYATFLLDPARANRRFVVTLARLWLAAHTGAFRYGLFVASAPPAT